MKNACVLVVLLAMGLFVLGCGGGEEPKANGTVEIPADLNEPPPSNPVPPGVTPSTTGGGAGPGAAAPGTTPGGNP
jgi:hypothetical protein